MSFDDVERWIIELFVIFSLVVTLLRVLAWDLEKLRAPKAPPRISECGTDLPRKLPRRPRQRVERRFGTRQKTNSRKKRAFKGS
jgi:hypothetical protein